MTLQKSAFLLKALGMHSLSHPKYIRPQTLAEVIRLVEELSAAHQLTATGTHSTVSMMSSDDTCFVCGQTGHVATTALKPSVMAVMNLAILPRTASTKFLYQEHHTTKEDFIQGINTPTTRETDHTPIMVPDIGDIRADHSPAPIHTATKAAPCTLLPATTADHTALQPMDIPVIPCTMITMGKVTPHLTLAISPTGATYTAPWSKAILTPAAPTMQHKILSPGR